MPSIVKNLLIFGTIALVAAGGYYLVVLERNGTIGGQNEVTAGQAEEDAKIFLRQLNQLEELEFRTDIFTDSRFTSLEDYTESVIQIPAGRSNPFATTP